MIVRLDLASAASPATQIATQIAAGIDAGEVGPGAPLPTIRALAGDLGVAPGTVARAYAELERDGWVVTQGRRGTSVAPGRPKRFDDDVAAAARASPAPSGRPGSTSATPTERSTSPSPASNAGPDGTAPTDSCDSLSRAGARMGA